MPDLYLVWGGIGDDLPWGIRCSTSLPNFEQPQTNLEAHGLSPTYLDSGASLLALSDRILYINAYQFDAPGFPLGLGHNDYMCGAYCQSWPNWALTGVNGGFPGSASNGNPALAKWGTGALAVWNGIGDDTQIWCSQYNQSQNAWSAQYLTELAGTGAPIQAGASPAIVSLNGVLFMVWRGEGSNDSLYYATSTDGFTWTGNRQIAGAASTHQPALVDFNGYPVLCFKGAITMGAFTPQPSISAINSGLRSTPPVHSVLPMVRP